MSEDDLFAEAMRKVRRLAEPAKSKPAKSPKRAGLQLRPAAAAALSAVSREPDFLPGNDWELLANGVSRERLKRVLASQPPAQTFDLHGMTRQEALTFLAARLPLAMTSGERILCLIHGRGRHSADKPVLREAVYHWLQQGPMAGQVLAVVPQPGSNGGACLVLLRRR